MNYENEPYTNHRQECLCHNSCFHLGVLCNLLFKKNLNYESRERHENMIGKYKAVFFASHFAHVRAFRSFMNQ